MGHCDNVVSTSIVIHGTINKKSRDKFLTAVTNGVNPGLILSARWGTLRNVWSHVMPPAKNEMQFCTSITPQCRWQREPGNIGSSRRAPPCTQRVPPRCEAVDFWAENQRQTDRASSVREQVRDLSSNDSWLRNVRPRRTYS